MKAAGRGRSTLARTYIGENERGTKSIASASRAVLREHVIKETHC